LGTASVSSSNRIAAFGRDLTGMSMVSCGVTSSETSTATTQCRHPHCRHAISERKISPAPSASACAASIRRIRLSESIGRGDRARTAAAVVDVTSLW
jgi:hypothetical protein